MKKQKKEPKAIVQRGGPGGKMKGGYAAKNPKATFKRLFKYLYKDYKIQFIFVVICIVLSAGISVLASAFLKPLIDDYITPLIGSASPNFAPLATALITVGLIYLFGVVASFIQQRLMINISNGTLKTIRDEMFKHMQSLPLKYFDTNTHGDVMSRYTNDTDSLREMLSRSITQLLSSAITIVGVLVTMLSYSWILTLVVLFVIFLSLQVTKWLGGKSGKHFMLQQKNLGAANGYIEEMIEGQKVVKVFNHEDNAKEEFGKLNENLRQSATKANGYANILMPIMMNIGNFLYVIIAFLGCALALNNVGGLTLGIIAAFLQLSRSFSQVVTQVSQQFNSIIMALAGAERIFAILDEPSEIDEGFVTLVKCEKKDDVLNESSNGSIFAWKTLDENGNDKYVELKGDVRFFDVDFSYTKEKKILNDINLYAKPGQKIAFIGSTGAGKTTITNLINRFYDIESGEITYDGIKIRDIKKNDLRRSLGIVLQETNLFTGTIADNIRFGKLDATDEEIRAAAKTANADFFISHLPQGYDTVISGNGGNLSQGQRQLLAIARAAVADPPVLILDEATSSVDTRTEKLIEKGLDSLMSGRTVFVIAHRLSTVRNSDAIIVLERGEIIERGNHESLIKEKGKYYQFYTGAFELD